MRGAPALGRSRLLRLADGRALAWAECGDPVGAPVLDFHGNPGCRLLSWASEGAVARAGVRLIGFDRAGIGHSDPAPHRSVASAADDPLELADALGLERFALLGYSLGGAYAAGLAARAPDRVRALALVSAVVPLGKLGSLGELGHAGQWRLAARSPGALALGYRLVAAIARRSPAAVGALAGIGLSGPDRTLVARPELRERLAAVAIEAARQGGRGTVEDMRTAMRPWGFSLGELSVPATIWQGDDDAAVPAAWGQRLAGAIPGAGLRLLPGEGHYLIDERLEEILSSSLRE